MKKILILAMTILSTQLFATVEMNAELYSYNRVSNDNYDVSDACPKIYQESEVMNDRVWKLYKIDKKLSAEMQSVLRNNINAAYDISLYENAKMTFSEVCRKLDKATNETKIILDDIL